MKQMKDLLQSLLVAIGLLRKKTTDDALTTFYKAVDELKKVEAEHTALADLHNEAKAVAEKAASIAYAEANRARSVAAKVAALITA